MEGRMTLPHIVTFDPGTCGNILNDPEREITSMKLGFFIQKNTSWPTISSARHSRYGKDNRTMKVIVMYYLLGFGPQ